MLFRQGHDAIGDAVGAFRDHARGLHDLITSALGTLAIMR